MLRIMASEAGKGMMSEKEKEFRFVIDTPKPLSMARIGEYMVKLGKLLGVPARLVRVEQSKSEHVPKTGAKAPPANG
jgi:hypothetical protein